MNHRGKSNSNLSIFTTFYSKISLTGLGFEFLYINMEDWKDSSGAQQCNFSKGERINMELDHLCLGKGGDQEEES